MDHDRRWFDWRTKYFSVQFTTNDFIFWLVGGLCGDLHSRFFIPRCAAFRFDGPDAIDFGFTTAIVIGHWQVRQRNTSGRLLNKYVYKQTHPIPTTVAKREMKNERVGHKKLVLSRQSLCKWTVRHKNEIRTATDTFACVSRSWSLWRQLISTVLKWIPVSTNSERTVQRCGRPYKYSVAVVRKCLYSISGGIICVAQLL